MKKFAVSLLFAAVALPTLAVEVYLNPNLDSFFTQTSPQVANALCFMYENNHYKCACRFSDNSKIWVSKPMEQFIGELGTMDDKYGYIEACRGASRMPRINK